MTGSTLRISVSARTSSLAVACALFGASISTAWAEYRIGPGDVLGITVIGMPELNARATVDTDGQATLPLIGDVAVAGTSLAAATAKVQAILPGKALNRRLDDGRELPVIIAPGQVSLSILEYRPIYVDGDVAKPGELRYRPGLTVRQAVALAGGFDLVRFKLDNPLIQISELTGTYNALSIDYAKVQAVMARLQAELDGKADIDLKPFAGAPIPPAFSDAIAKNQQEQLTFRNLDFEKERAYLADASKKETQRAEILAEQKVKDTEGAQFDAVDLQRLEDLFKKGAVAIPTLSEARRTVLGSSTRALQTTASLASIEREEGELGRRADRLSDSRRLQLLNDMADATAKLAGIRAEMQTVSTKLRYTGMVKTELVKGFDSDVKITITRIVDGQATQIAAAPDAELQPGDVAGVVLQASGLVAATQ